MQSKPIAVYSNQSDTCDVSAQTAFYDFRELEGGISQTDRRGVLWDPQSRVTVGVKTCGTSLF